MIDVEESRWSTFRRTLRPAQRAYLDSIFDHARAVADAGTMIATPRTTEVALLSTMIALLEKIDDVNRRLSAIERALENA